MQFSIINSALTPFGSRSRANECCLRDNENVSQQIMTVNIGLSNRTCLFDYYRRVLQESGVAHQSAPGVQIGNNRRESSDINSTCVTNRDRYPKT